MHEWWDCDFMEANRTRWMEPFDYSYTAINWKRVSKPGFHGGEI